MKKAILTLLIAALGVSAYAQSPDPDTTARHFIIMASIGNLQEVSSGHLAIQKSKRAAIRSFGQMMIKDHSQSQQQLLQLAKNQNIAIPQEATTGIQEDLNMKNAGDNFDGLYVHAMTVDHRSTVQMFENYAITGKNPVLREFARQMLPTLKAHLVTITAIDKQLNMADK